MQITIQIKEVNNTFKVSAVQENGAPLGMPAQFEQYVPNPMQIARAVKWLREDLDRNFPEVMAYRVDNMTLLSDPAIYQ